MPKNILAEMGSQVGLTPARQNKKISPTVVQNMPGEEDYPVLKPKVWQKVRPIKEMKRGVRVDNFWLSGRYHRSEMKYLRPFLCLALPKFDGTPASDPVPVQIGISLSRRSISLRDTYGHSIPVVVTQVKHEGRWVVTASLEPCPQFVIHNHTSEKLALAHMRRNHETFFHDVPVMPEVLGAKWYNVLQPDMWTYYATMWYMEHYAVTTMPDHSEKRDLTQLAVGRVHREHEREPQWSAPFKVEEGEQLVQLTRDQRIKVKINVHPHSTYIDVLNVDEDDVSASEIRERLALSDKKASHYSHSGFSPETQKLMDRWREQLIAAMPPNRPGNFPGKAFKPNRSKKEKEAPEESSSSITQRDLYSETSLPKEELPKMRTEDEDDDEAGPPLNDWARGVVGCVVLELAHACSVRPLLRATVDRVAFLLHSDEQLMYCALTAGDFQVDNTQHASRRYDFAVVASTSAEQRCDERFPALWGMLLADHAFDPRLEEDSNAVLRLCFGRWAVFDRHYQQLCDVEMYVGRTCLYVEDSLVRETTQLLRLLVPQPELDAAQMVMAETAALVNPLHLSLLHLHPVDIILTLHTAMRFYIAVDHSALSLPEFRIEDLVSTPDELMHDLTVHYLSAFVLAAGWVVSGLELFGAPGTLATRVVNASGGVRGLMAATGAALLRSVNSCAGSLARNLDLLAGDDEHTQRAAAARREHPPTFMAGIATGVQNFGVNLLGAVGGLAHHPLVGLAVGEASGAAALRRGLVGALAKPLSATADLLAFAGQGLLSQTGWDPDPKQREVPELETPESWRRDCVRWGFRLHTLPALFGVDATMDDTPVRLVVTDKFLVVAEPDTERIVEMIDYRFCQLESFDGQVVDIRVTHRSPHSRRENHDDSRDSDEAYPHSSSEAMARVARYTGVGGADGLGAAVRIRTAPYNAPALAAALAVALRQGQPTHFSLL